MRIGILQCGEVPDELAEGHGRIGEMMRRLLPPGREALLEARREVHGPGTDRAVQSLREPHDSARMQRWIGRFLEG